MSTSRVCTLLVEPTVKSTSPYPAIVITLSNCTTPIPSVFGALRRHKHGVSEQSAVGALPILMAYHDVHSSSITRNHTLDSRLSRNLNKPQKRTSCTIKRILNLVTYLLHNP